MNRLNFSLEKTRIFFEVQKSEITIEIGLFLVIWSIHNASCGIVRKSLKNAFSTFVIFFDPIMYKNVIKIKGVSIRFGNPAKKIKKNGANIKEGVA